MATTLIPCPSGSRLPLVQHHHQQQQQAKVGDGYHSSFFLSAGQGSRFTGTGSSPKYSGVKVTRRYFASLQQQQGHATGRSNGKPSQLQQSRGGDLSSDTGGNGVAKVTSSNVCWQQVVVTKQERRDLLQQKGCIVWITGFSGSGKTTVAFNVDKMLTSMGKLSYVLDGDNLRHGLCSNLGFSAADRQENIRRVGETAKLFADAGMIVLVSLISPYRRERDFVRTLVQSEEFVEVFMNVSLEVCERRDCKGLYKLARAGVIKGFTGVDDPYEKPLNPEISLMDTNEQGAHVCPDEMAGTIVRYLSDNGYLRASKL